MSQVKFKKFDDSNYTVISYGIYEKSPTESVNAAVGLITKRTTGWVFVQKTAFKTHVSVGLGPITLRAIACKLIALTRKDSKDE